jgi:membrane dipeptidase
MKKRSGIPPITQRHLLVATHSNAHALCPQPRNLTDQQLRAIRDSGGVVGVTFGNAFLRADGRRDSDTPLTTIVRHIDYLINIMGEDHVALGSDFDGITLPDELGDVAGLPRLINALRASGYDQLVLDKLLWRNWLRVLKCLATIGYIVNIKLIPYRFRLISPGEA